MNAYYFIVVPFMAVMCIVFVWIIAGDIKTILRSMRDSKHDSIRPSRRDYGQAAVFVGTACLLIGTPQECDDLCDDLWHYGQQARMEMLTGEEQAFDVM